MYKLTIADKTLIVADPHWGFSNDSSLYIRNTVSTFDWIISECKNRGINTVVVLGDWFHNRNYLSVKTSDEAYNALKKITAEGIKIIIIVGNHDLYYRDNAEVSSIKPYSEMPMVEIVNGNVIYDTPSNKKILMSSWDALWKDEILQKELIDGKNKIDYMFGHFNFIGAMMKGKINSSGFGGDYLTQMCPKVFSGHFHLGKKYDFKNGFITVVGSPMEFDWSDYKSPKGIYAIDFANDMCEFIRNPVSPIHVKFLWSEVIKNAKNTISNVRGNFVKLVIDSEYDYDKVVKVCTLIDSMKPIEPCDVEYLYNVDFSSVQSNEQSGEEIFSELDKKSQVSSFLRSATIPAELEMMKIEEISNMYLDRVEEKISRKSDSNKFEFKVESVRTKNFLSVGSQRFDFDKHAGLNYVYGINQDVAKKKEEEEEDSVRNGSGKSAMFVDAVYFALYGKTFREIKKTSIPHRLKKKNCEISLMLSNKNNRYLVRNGISPTFVTIHEISDSTMDMDEILTILASKSEDSRIKDITKSGMEESMEFIQKEITGMTPMLAKNVMLLAIGDTETSLPKMKKEQKRKFVEAMFDMTKYGDAFKLVNSDRNTLEKEVNSLMIESNSIKATLERMKEEREAFDVRKKQKILELETKVRSKKEEFELAKKALEECPDATSELISINEKIEKLRVSESKISGAISTNQGKISGLQLALTGKAKLIKSLVNAVCDSCKAKVAEAAACTDDLKRMDEAVSSIPELEKSTKELMELKEKLNKSIEPLKLKMREITSKNNDRKLREQIVNNKKSECEVLLSELKNAVTQTFGFESMIEKHENDLVALKQKYEEKTAYMKYVDYIHFLFSEDGIKKFITQSIIDVLNSRIKNYLDRMGCEYVSKINPDFELEFMTVSGPCEYNNFSAGEKRRIDIASTFSMRDMLMGKGMVKPNMIVCDEILDVSTDRYCIKSIIKLLKEQSEKMLIIVVSHRECVSPESFDNIIEIRKAGGFTKITSDQQCQIQE